MLYGVPLGSAVRGVLDVRARQHALHFVINDELLPFAIVKIPDDESVHMGVWVYGLYVHCYILLN
jgi:hypothetical protein